MATKTKPWPKLHVFKTPAYGHKVRDLWRWHLVAPNGKIIACSGEGFKTKQGCVRSMRTVLVDFVVAQTIYDAPVLNKKDWAALNEALGVK